MFKNYFKIAVRTILRNKTYSIINIFGLSIGIACAILIILWVHDELSYDRFHKNSSDLFLVVQKSYNQNGIEYDPALPYPAAEELKSDYPEILAVSRVYYSKEFLFVHNDKRFIENQILMVDPEFLTMFSFPLVHGDAKQVLNNPNSVVITKKIAQKYFGDANPVGKTFRVDNQYDLTITGVLGDIPRNSHLDFSILVPLSSELIIHKFDTDKWQYIDYDFNTYVLLRKNQKYNDVSKKITPLLQKHIKDCETELYLYPIIKLHTNPDIAPEESRPIDMKYINIFIVIAFLVLLIACINFMNLSTARSTIRAQEIGIRKVVGSNRRNLITQFLGESLLLALIAGFLAILIVELLLPFFNRLSGTPLTIDYSNVGILLSFGTIILFVGIAAGSYPAFYLSAFRPVTVLKGKLMVDLKSSRLRKIFVVVQFSLSICFIIGAAIFYDQLNYMKNKEVGYDKDNLISVPLVMPWGTSIRRQYFTFKAELLNNPNIIGVTQSFSSPADIMTAGDDEADWDGKLPNQTVNIHWLTVHFDYCKTLGIKILEGRPFSREFKTDVWNDGKVSFIVNEETVKRMGVKSAIGMKFTLFHKTGPIIGVIKNFHYHHMKTRIEPIALFIMGYYNKYVLIKLQPENKKESLDFIKRTWEKFSPDYPFEYSFVSKDYNSLYLHEEKMGEILTAFTVFAILIACLGLWGLTSFIMERRTKEIGIRKVLGSSVLEIITILIKDFTQWILLANLIAWPIAWYVMNWWLQNFAYKIDISWWEFVFSGGIALVIALTTVSFQAIKAATANPVESLRYE